MEILSEGNDNGSAKISAFTFAFVECKYSLSLTYGALLIAQRTRNPQCFYTQYSCIYNIIIDVIGNQGARMSNRIKKLSLARSLVRLTTVNKFSRDL